MKRMSQFIAAVAMCTAMGQASAVEIQLQAGSQTMPDPNFGIVSDLASVSTFGLRAAHRFSPGSNLSYFVGYDYGARYNYGEAYDYDYDEDYSDSTYADTSIDIFFGLHGIEAGVRLEYPLARWLKPYVSVNGRGYLGYVSFEDGLTGWEYLDPSDPTGETALYTAEPTLDYGFSGGVQANIGVSLLFPPRKPKAIALNSALQDSPRAGAYGPTEAGTSAGDEDAASMEEPGSPAPAAATSDPSQKIRVRELPKDSAEAKAASGEQEAGNANAAASRDDGEAGEESDRTGVTKKSSKKSKRSAWRGSSRTWTWGLNFEVGYGLLSELRFSQAGALDMGGLRAQGGFVLSF